MTEQSQTRFRRSLALIALGVLMGGALVPVMAALRELEHGISTVPALSLISFVAALTAGVFGLAESLLKIRIVPTAATAGIVLLGLSILPGTGVAAVGGAAAIGCAVLATGGAQAGELKRKLLWIWGVLSLMMVFAEPRLPGGLMPDLRLFAHLETPAPTGEYCPEPCPMLPAILQSPKLSGKNLLFICCECRNAPYDAAREPGVAEVHVVLCRCTTIRENLRATAGEMPPEIAEKIKFIASGSDIPPTCRYDVIVIDAPPHGSDEAVARLGGKMLDQHLHADGALVLPGSAAGTLMRKHPNAPLPGSGRMMVIGGRSPEMAETPEKLEKRYQRICGDEENYSIPPELLTPVLEYDKLYREHHRGEAEGSVAIFFPAETILWLGGAVLFLTLLLFFTAAGTTRSGMLILNLIGSVSAVLVVLLAARWLGGSALCEPVFALPLTGMLLVVLNRTPWGRGEWASASAGLLLAPFLAASAGDSSGLLALFGCAVVLRAVTWLHR